LDGVTLADLQARFDLATQIRDRTSEANEAVIRIREIKAQIDERLEGTENPQLSGSGDALERALSEVEGEIYQVRNQSNQDPLNFPIKLNNKLAALLGVVEGSENRPTDQSYEVFEYLSGLLQVQLDRLGEVLDGDLVAFNRELAEMGLEPVRIEPRG
jgi:predicted ribosome quality control (RQC) complex YloA/Tae2 family protein